LLEALVSGGIVPVQVLVTVWPMVDGTVTVLVGGVEAKLSTPKRIATEQRLKANKMRGLKRPELEVGFAFIRICLCRLTSGQFDSR
jgi:hypothetical protein